MSVVHRRLSRKAQEERQTGARPPRDKTPVKTENSNEHNRTSPAPSFPDALEKQLDGIEALLDTQEQEQEQLQVLMDQLEDKLGAVERILTHGAAENHSAVER